MVVTLLAVKEDVTVAAELPLQLPMCLGYDLMDGFTCKISRLKFQIRFSLFYRSIFKECEFKG